MTYLSMYLLIGLGLYVYASKDLDDPRVKEATSKLRDRYYLTDRVILVCFALFFMALWPVLHLLAYLDQGDGE